MRSCLAAALLVLGCGCLPERTNPHDPAVAPRAALVLVDDTLADGSCPLVAGTGGVPRLALSRGRCAYLDASASTDAHADALIGASYEFFLVSTSGEPVSMPSYSQLPFLRVDLRGLPLDRPSRFLVEVRDGHGIGTTERTVAVLNAPPVADAGPPRTIPVGGLPWAPGAPVALAFPDFGSSDEDGDVVIYCWKFPEEAPAATSCTLAADPLLGLCSPVRAHACFTRSLEASRWGSVVAELRVSDGDAVSDPALAVVHVREPNIWGLKQDGTRPFLFDATRRRFPAGLSGISAIFDDESPLLLQARSPNIVARDPYTGEVQASLDTGTPFFGNAALVVDPGRRIAWHASADYDAMGDAARAYAFTTTPGASISVSSPLVPLTFDYPVVDAPHLATVDSSGTFWVVPYLNGPIATVDLGGVAGPRFGDPGRVFVSLAARPGTDEVWAVDVPDPVGGTPSSGARLFRFYGAEGGFDVYTTTRFHVGWMNWVDTDHFWAVDSETGLSLVDVRPLLEGAAFEDAVDVSHLDLTDLFFLQVDRLTGTCFAGDYLFNASFVALRDGSLRIDEPAIPLAIAPDGTNWNIAAGGFIRGLSANSSGHVLEIHRVSYRAPMPDGTGGAWIHSDSPPALLHVAEDATQISYEQTMRIDGALEPMPIFDALSLDGGREAMWAITPSDRLLRVDLSVSPPEARAVSLAVGSLRRDLFLASADPASPPFLWTLFDTGSTLQVVVLTTNGVISPIHTLLPEEQNGPVPNHAKGARSMANNRLCLGLLDATNGLWRVRRLAPDPVVEDLGTVVVGTSFAAMFTHNDLHVAASSDGSTDVCWTAVGFLSTDTTSIRSWSATATSWRSWDGSGTSQFIYAFGNYDLWMTRADSSGGNPAVRLDLTLEASPTRIDLFPAENRFHLVGHETSIPTE